MRRSMPPLLILLAAMPAAMTPATAQTPTSPAAAAPAAVAPPAPAPHPLVGGGDFISPVGEPFHSPDSLSGAEHWFQGADADHDGRLTRAEFLADGGRFFARLDVDHDGEIGPAEIDRYEGEIAPEIRVGSTGSIYAPQGEGDEGSEPEQAPYPDRLGAGRFGYVDLPEPIVAMDSNLDRGISRAEFDRAAQQRFAALDTNHDGALTREELPALHGNDAGGRSRGRHHRR